jgi:hypothetical protein
MIPLSLIVSVPVMNDETMGKLHLSWRTGTIHKHKSGKLLQLTPLDDNNDRVYQQSSQGGNIATREGKSTSESGPVRRFREGESACLLS